jgi:hypothetical protein
MNDLVKIKPSHTQRTAFVYIRQSSPTSSTTVSPPPVKHARHTGKKPGSRSCRALTAESRNLWSAEISSDPARKSLGPPELAVSAATVKPVGLFGYLGCLAMIRVLILSYVGAGMIFLLSRSVFTRYGRPAMIFCEYASPMPGRAFN